VIFIAHSWILEPGCTGFSQLLKGRKKNGKILWDHRFRIDPEDIVDRKQLVSPTNRLNEMLGAVEKCGQVITSVAADVSNVCNPLQLLVIGNI
jgi:hypothetical protein